MASFAKGLPHSNCIIYQGIVGRNLFFNLKKQMFSQNFSPENLKVKDNNHF